jgi:Na+-driven multidrug efflux pump
LGVVTEMTMQSSGRKMAASVISALKSGVYFIPAILLLTHFRGLSGIQEAQPVADILAFLTSIPFAIHYFRSLPKTAEEEALK